MKTRTAALTFHFLITVPVLCMPVCCCGALPPAAPADADVSRQETAVCGVPSDAVDGAPPASEDDAAGRTFAASFYPRTAEEERRALLSRRAERPGPLRFGSDRLFDPEYLPLIAGRRAAIMANQTSRSTVDRLIDDARTTLVAIFAPEHGFQGVQAAGEQVSASTYRGVNVYGCYGGGDETRRIPAALLNNVDVLLFELQDVGTRHYTFISSMYLAMDAAADAGIDFVVLDRPVAVNGEAVEGPVLERECQTFIGIGRLPNRYGMTIGELALLFKHEPGIMDGPRYPRAGEGDAFWNVKDVRLFVVPMSGYDRTLCFDEQRGAPVWVPPSPNIPSVTAALCYVGAGLFDGNTIAEIVRGYEQFVYIVVPFVKSREELEAFIDAAGRHYDFPGVALEPCLDGREGRQGLIRLAVTDRARFNPSLTALALLYTQALCRPSARFFSSDAGRRSFTQAWGVSWLAALFADPSSLPPFAEIVRRLEKDVEEFRTVREKYLLY